MAGPFDTWLRYLQLINKGPLQWVARRGVIFSANLTFEGDWTGTTIRGSVRASPDSQSELVAFNISAAVVGAETTLFNVAIAANSVLNLPEDSDADGITTLVYDLLISVPGEDEELLWGGEFVVLGRVTS